MNFDDMQKADGDEPDYEYDFDDFDTVDFDVGTTVVGELLARREDVGQYDTDVFLLECVETGDYQMVWSNGSIDAKVDAADDLQDGDILAIRKSEETYENEHGEFHEWDVRYQKAE